VLVSLNHHSQQFKLLSTRTHSLFFSCSPASKSGQFVEGDILVKVNEDSISGLNVQQVSQKIVGEKGSQLVLTSKNISRVLFNIAMPSVHEMCPWIISNTRVSINGGTNVAAMNMQAF
jgi:hypothetical protein